MISHLKNKLSGYEKEDRFFMKKIIPFILALSLSLTALISCGEQTGAAQSGENAPTPTTPPPKEETALDWCVYKTERDVTGHDTCKIKMTVKDYGEITLLLDATTAPETVANFKKLVTDGFYNGLTFHRIVENFMIQGGCPRGDGGGSTEEKIKGEFSSNGHENDISHLRGVISMARGDDKNSASCQFFICNADSTGLDGRYAAFGYVIEGMSTVDKITSVAVKYCEGETIKIKALQPVIEKMEIIE